MTRYDPTKTKTLRNKFIRALRKELNKLNRKIQHLIVKLDAFGLGATYNAERTILPGEFAFQTDSAKLAEFEQWLKEQRGTHFSSQELWESYIQEGYEKGAARAFQYVEKSDLFVDSSGSVRGFMAGRQSEFLVGLLNGPESAEKLQLLVSRTLTDIVGIGDVLSVKLRRHLADGLAQGDNPRIVARRMANDIRRTRYQAERIARTEIIRAHAEGQLDSLERMGVDQVQVEVEWSTAGDDRVCPQCSPMEGVVIEISKAHNLIPLHPNCRCAWLPANVGEQRGRKKSVAAAAKRSINSRNSKLERLL